MTDPSRFIQPDSTIPDYANPQSYNRYSYCVNDPLKFNDPSGHSWIPWWEEFKGRLALNAMVREHTEYRTYEQFMQSRQKNPVFTASDINSVVIGGHAAGGIANTYISIESTIVAPEARVASAESSTAGNVEVSAGQETLPNDAQAISKTEVNQTKGWKVGDPINNLTAAGNEPSWSTVRQRFWKNEAANNPSQYTAEQLARMRKGLAPQRVNPDSAILDFQAQPEKPGQFTWNAATAAFNTVMKAHQQQAHSRIFSESWEEVFGPPDGRRITQADIDLLTEKIVKKLFRIDS